MPSQIKVDQIAGASGNTVTVPSGQTLDISSATLSLPSTVVTTTGAQTLTNKTIGVSQLSGTLPVANGGTGLTSLGTANQVIKVNSGATGLEYGSLSSDKVRLATTTVSSSVSSLEITTGFSDTYSIYELYWFNTTFSGTSVKLRLQFGYGGTPTYVTSSYHSLQQGLGVEDANGTSSIVGGTPQGDGIYLSADWSVITSSNRTFNGKMVLFNLRATSTVNKYGATSNCVYKHSSSNYTVSSIAGGYAEDATLRSNAVTAIKLLPNNGTIDSGTFVLYGIKTS